MIAYLNGTIARIYAQQNRVYLDLEVGGIGYEIQVLSRWAETLDDRLSQECKVLTHLQVREDQWLLFGFATATERDLFRELISVSGIGAQSAIALLDALEINLLLEAIVSGNVRVLSKAPGIGKKTAERLTLELKTKLKGWAAIVNSGVESNLLPIEAIQEEVELTLLSLGYTDREIFQALVAVGRETNLTKTGDPDDWLRETLAWLSQQDA
ncbi:MAG: Holliday junction branch migration protein RuvA [Prochlorotrichaceae cyanobacterium]